MNIFTSDIVRNFLIGFGATTAVLAIGFVPSFL